MYKMSEEELSDPGIMSPELKPGYDKKIILDKNVSALIISKRIAFNLFYI